MFQEGATVFFISSSRCYANWQYFSLSYWNILVLALWNLQSNHYSLLPFSSIRFYIFTKTWLRIDPTNRNDSKFPSIQRKVTAGLIFLLFIFLYFVLGTDGMHWNIIHSMVKRHNVCIFSVFNLMIYKLIWFKCPYIINQRLLF